LKDKIVELESELNEANCNFAQVKEDNKNVKRELVTLKAQEICLSNQQ
jgi:hypothetical protein